MAKIPKGLSDKDMLQGYVEETTMESHFLAAEASDDKKRREKAFAEMQQREKNINMAGFTDQLIDDLGKKLLELKMELYREGVKNYIFKVKREGDTITMKAVEVVNKKAKHR